MDLTHLSTLSSWPYYGVLVAAIVEGEVTYIAAAALVAQGQLHPLGVLISGALGAAIGDQIFFYVFADASRAGWRGIHHSSGRQRPSSTARGATAP